MDTYKEKIEKLDTELDKIFDELKEVFKKLVFKSMIYRDLHLDNVKEQLEESFDKLSPGLKEKLKWIREKLMMMNTELDGIIKIKN